MVRKSARAKAQAKNKAAKELKRQREEKAAGPDQPLLEKQEKQDCDHIAKKGRTRTDQNKFNKMLRDNLLAYGFKVEELKYLQSKVKGDYLLDRLNSDRELWRLGQLTMGSTYWMDFRAEFRNPDCPWAQMEPEDDTQVEDQECFECLVGLFTEPRETAAFELFSSSVTSMNDTTLCAYYRGLLMLPVQKGFDVCDLVVKGMECTARLDLQTSFKKRFGLMFDHFDETLQQVLHHYQNQDHTTKEWWTDTAHYSGLLLPAADMEKIVNRTKDWSPIAASVYKVHSIGGIGKMLTARIVWPSLSQLFSAHLQYFVALSYLSKFFERLCCSTTDSTNTLCARRQTQTLKNIM